MEKQRHSREVLFERTVPKAFHLQDARYDPITQISGAALIFLEKFRTVSIQNGCRNVMYMGSNLNDFLFHKLKLQKQSI